MAIIDEQLACWDANISYLECVKRFSIYTCRDFIEKNKVNVVQMINDINIERLVKLPNSDFVLIFLFAINSHVF